MKTFKQFMEKFIKTNATPKGTFTYPYDTREGGIFDKIRTKDAVDYENAEFLRNTGIPIDLVKKKKDKKLIASHDKRLFKTPPATGAAADVIAGDKFKDAAGVGKGSIKSGTPNNPFGVKV